MKRVLTALVLALTLATPALAQERINDAAALAGITEAKGVFLVDFTDVDKTAFYLEIIEGTWQGFKDQGVDPDLVLVFIGPTVEFLTTEPAEDLAFEKPEALERIAGSIARLNALGVRMEVCAIATRVFGIDNADLLPGLNLTADGFVSLIGWQTQGYKLVPLY